MSVLGAELFLPPALQFELADGAGLVKFSGATKRFLLIERKPAELREQFIATWRALDCAASFAQFIDEVGAAHVDQLAEERQRARAFRG
jgi:hypothetical protein